MKNFNLKVATLSLAFGIGISASNAQCTINPVAEEDVILDGINVDHSGIAVGYNPDEQLYYAGDGGGTYGNLITFNNTGLEVAAGIFCGYDFRGVWWNPNTSELEANSYASVGIRECDLDASEYALNTGEIILPSGQPNIQSQGDYDWDADEIIYYFNGEIYRYSHVTGAFITSYPITGLPVPTGNLSQHTIGYTGCAGQEIVVYDLVLQAAYTINKSTGAYVATSEMPDDAVTPGVWFNVSFANGQVFIRSGNDWYGYRIFPECSAMTVTATATEVCEDEEVTLDAEADGTISWTGGITDEEPFIPGPPGTYTYTPSSDDPEVCEGAPIEITVVGLPTVIAGAGDLIFCEDESITLSAAGDADVYEWNDGEDLDLMPGAGTYTFTLTGAYTEGTCLGENEDEVTVEVVDLPTISGSSDVDVTCVGNEVTLTGSGGVSYTWDDAVVTDGVPFTTTMIGTTTYTVTGTDENGCVNTGTVDVEVVDLVSISGTTTDEIMGGDGGIDITVSGGAPAYTFDWDNDGTGDPDDTEDLTDLAAGEYTVIVVSEAGCSDTATFSVRGQLSINNLDEQVINIYPNPTAADVTIEWAGNFQYTLSAINGDVIFTGNGMNKKMISLADLSDGIYFITLNSDEVTKTSKIVKK